MKKIDPVLLCKTVWCASGHLTHFFILPRFRIHSYISYKMPKSKKGRLSGGARKELNDRRATDAVSGLAKDVTFARVTKMVGAGHVRAAIECRHGQKELLARIPNVLSRRGATPITTNSVVALYVGPGFDPNEALGASDHFDITAVLSPRQAYALSKNGTIPGWMFDPASIVGGESAAKKDDEDGFEFDYSGGGGEVDSEDSSDSKKAAAAKGGAGARKPAADEDDVDIDAI